MAGGRRNGRGGTKAGGKISTTAGDSPLSSTEHSREKSPLLSAQASPRASPKVAADALGDAAKITLQERFSALKVNGLKDNEEGNETQQPQPSSATAVLPDDASLAAASAGCNNDADEDDCWDSDDDDDLDPATINLLATQVCFPITLLIPIKWESEVRKLKATVVTHLDNRKASLTADAQTTMKYQELLPAWLSKKSGAQLSVVMYRSRARGCDGLLTCFLMDKKHTITFCELNINGLGSAGKPTKCRTWLRGKADIAVLTVTRVKADHNFWTQLKPTAMAAVGPAGAAGGVAVLSFVPGMVFTDMYLHDLGRLVAVVVRWGDLEVLLIAAYLLAQPKNRAPFYRDSLGPFLGTLPNLKNILVMGDFNVIEDPELDKSTVVGSAAENMRLMSFWARTPVTDAFQYVHLGKREYTFHAKGKGVSTRIDRALLSQPLGSFGGGDESGVGDAATGPLMRTISDMSREALSAPWSEQEVRTAVRELAPGKTPGQDGLPKELFEHNWDLLGPVLMQFVDDFTRSLKLLSSVSTEVTVLLHKKGSKEELGNYRPITLLNTVYKILAKVLATRLKKVLHEVISEDHAGFLSGRKLADAVTVVANAIEAGACGREDWYLLMIDFRKAFDSILRPFLFRMLRRMGIPEVFVTWAEGLHKETGTRVHVNGWTGETVAVKKGVRQGCPLAPYLFLRAVEPLCQELSKCKLGIGRRDTGKLTFLGYTDNTSLLLRGAEQVSVAAGVLDDFGKKSGLKVNHDKTVLFPLGRNRGKPPPTDLQYKWADKGEPERLLGVWITPNRDPLPSWEKTLDKARKELAKWEVEWERLAFNRRIPFRGASPFQNQKDTDYLLELETMGDLVQSLGSGERALESEEVLTRELGSKVAAKMALKAFAAAPAEWRNLVMEKLTISAAEGDKVIGRLCPVKDDGSFTPCKGDNLALSFGLQSGEPLVA
ncbi:unnamed protein product [Closterium sp. NIES-65]|nr:unnamed protein product [Closterium sp. NIES-65]